MATAVALMGGVGIVHYNNSIEAQAKEVRSVKRYPNAISPNPWALGTNYLP